MRKEKSYMKRERLMKFNNLFSSYKVIVPLLGGAILVGGLIVNYIINLARTFNPVTLSFDRYESFFETFSILGNFWLVYLGVATILAAKALYNIRIYHGDLSVEQKGGRRWTTREELEEQYKKIPEKDLKFEGKGGTPVARTETEIYIDESPVHVLNIGTSRSGKGEEHVLPCIDIYSRAEHQPSLILSDVKLELASQTMETLKRRGYETYLLNLVDPEFSMGYNLFPVIVEEVKRGEEAAAQQLLRSLAYNVIPSNPDDNQPYWDNMARNVFIACSWSEILDNLALDKEINERRLYKHKKKEKKQKRIAIAKLSLREQEAFKYKEAIDETRKIDVEASLEEIKEKIIADIEIGELKKIDNEEYPKISYQEKEFIPSTKFEDKITIYSIVKMVNTLNGITIGKKTALDKHFALRPENDFGRLTFASVGATEGNTRGSIMSTFQERVAIFLYANIAKVTSKSSLDMLKVGFGDKPIAVFIGLPDYDKSNHFIATCFINQLYFTLAKAATAMPGGKCYRDVVFLLDEFGNLPPLDNIDNIVSVGLGRGLFFHFIVQSFSQITNLYGENTKNTIINNCGLWKYILTTEMETAEVISKNLGNETITTVNRTGKKLSLSKEMTEMQEEKPLLFPQELVSLKPRETVILRPLKRMDLKGKGVTSFPIGNIGEYKMKFRYDYLLDVFPQNKLLYKSRNLGRIEERLGAIDFKNSEYVKHEWPNYESITLEDISKPADYMLKRGAYFNDLIEDLDDEEKEQLAKVSTLEIEEEMAVGDFYFYAKNLLKEDPEDKEAHEILDTLFPLDEDDDEAEETEEEINQKEEAEFDNEIFAEIEMEMEGNDE